METQVELDFDAGPLEDRRIVLAALERLRHLPGAYHRGGPEAERLSAELVAKDLPAQRVRVAGFLGSRGEEGATDWEGADTLYMLRTSYGRARHRLKQVGLALNTGRKRKSKYDKPNTIWVASPELRRAWREILGHVHSRGE